jgi:hypothetical protein
MKISLQRHSFGLRQTHGSLVGLFGGIDPRRAVPSGVNRSIAALDNSVIAALNSRGIRGKAAPAESHAGEARKIVF